MLQGRKWLWATSACLLALSGPKTYAQDNDDVTVLDRLIITASKRQQEAKQDRRGHLRGNGRGTG